MSDHHDLNMTCQYYCTQQDIMGNSYYDKQPHLFLCFGPQKRPS